jgi:hypothetical protein
MPQVQSISDYPQAVQSISILVSDWSTYLKRDLIKSMLKKKIGNTGNLKNSLSFKIQYGTDGTPEKVIIAFNYYGKFVDMGVGKGQKLGDVKGNKALYRATGIKGRVAKPWWSKTIFPEANTLAALLKEQYGITAINMINENVSPSINMQL